MGIQSYSDSSKADDYVENPQLPIDPYDGSYWESCGSPPQRTTRPNTKLMEPSPPLVQPLDRQNSLLPPSVGMRTAPDPRLRLPKMRPVKLQKQIAPELLDQFKASIQGSDFTKIGLLEILKKQHVFAPSFRRTFTLTKNLDFQINPKTQ